MLFGEFLYGLRLNQRTDKYLPLPKSGRGYKPKDFILPRVLMLNACLPTGRKEDEWRPYENGSYIAETVHCMEKTNQAFRLIVVRKPYQPRLSGEEEIDLKERYKVIATNFDWPKDVVVKWKSLLFSFNFHLFSCQKSPFPKINRGFWGKTMEKSKKEYYLYPFRPYTIWGLNRRNPEAENILIPRQKRILATLPVRCTQTCGFSTLHVYLIHR